MRSARPGSPSASRARRPHRVAAALFFVAAALLLATPAAAAPESAITDLCVRDPVCKLRLDKAVHLYEHNRISEALAEFQAAYEIQPEPRLLINIGRVMFRLGRPSSALDHYEQFKRKVPDPGPETRRAIERYIAEAQAALDAEERAARGRSRTPDLAPGQGATQAGTAVDSAPASKPIYRKWWFWVGTGTVVAAALAVGLGVGLSQSSAASVPEWTWR